MFIFVEEWLASLLAEASSNWMVACFVLGLVMVWLAATSIRAIVSEYVKRWYFGQK